MVKNLKRFVTVSGVLLTTLGMMLFISCSKDSTNFASGGGSGGNGGVCGASDDGGGGGGGCGIVTTLGENPFVTTWDDTNIVTIPMNPDLDYNFVVQWGEDGPTQQVTNADTDDSVDGVITISHDFSETLVDSLASGPHKISISGNFPAIQFGVEDDSDVVPFDSDMASKITFIDQWGNIEWKTMNMAFAMCPNLRVRNNDIPVILEVRDFSEMFLNTGKANPDMRSWEFEIVRGSTNMDRMLDNSGMNTGNYHNLLKQLTGIGGGFGSTINVPNGTGVRLTARGIRYCTAVTISSIPIIGDIFSEDDFGLKALLTGDKGFSITDDGGTPCR